MISEFDTDKITLKARIAFLLICIEKIIDIFADHRDTELLVNKITADCWNWMKTRGPDCGKNYLENNPLLIEQELMHQDDPVLLKAIHAVMYMHYYVINKMYIIEFYETGKKNAAVGNDIFEVDESYFFDCLNHCIEISKDPGKLEHWINESIQKLNEKYLPENSEDLGQDIKDKNFLQ